MGKERGTRLVMMGSHSDGQTLSGVPGPFGHRCCGARGSIVSVPRLCHIVSARCSGFVMVYYGLCAVFGCLLRV